MRELRFTVPGVPVAQPRQRQRAVTTKAGGSFIQNYTPTKHPVNVFKAAVIEHASRAMQANGWSPFGCPVSVDCTFIMPRPKSDRRASHLIIPSDKKPDIDNLFKALTDAMTGIVYVDDKQIWIMRADKMLSARFGQPECRVCVCFDETDYSKVKPVLSSQSQGSEPGTS